MLPVEQVDADTAALRATFDAAIRAHADAEAHYLNEYYRRLEEAIQFIKADLADMGAARDAAEVALTKARYALQAARNGGRQ
jgi:hypothetical protein